MRSPGSFHRFWHFTHSSPIHTPSNAEQSKGGWRSLCGLNTGRRSFWGIRMSGNFWTDSHYESGSDKSTAGATFSTKIESFSMCAVDCNVWQCCFSCISINCCIISLLSYSIFWFFCFTVLIYAKFWSENDDIRIAWKFTHGPISISRIWILNQKEWRGELRNAKTRSPIPRV